MPKHQLSVSPTPEVYRFIEYLAEAYGMTKTQLVIAASIVLSQATVTTILDAKASAKLLEKGKIPLDEVKGFQALPAEKQKEVRDAWMRRIVGVTAAADSASMLIPGFPVSSLTGIGRNVAAEGEVAKAAQESPKTQRRPQAGGGA